MQSEERYPLLLVFAEENGGNGGSGYREPRRVFLERGRTIASGANSVFARWPSHLTTFWTVLVLFLATVGLLLAMSLVLAAFGHLAMSSNQSLVRHTFECRMNRTKREEIGESTNFTMYLVHTRRSWTRNQLDLVDEIAHHFRHIDILILNFNKKCTTGKTASLVLNSADTKATTKFHKWMTKHRTTANEINGGDGEGKTTQFGLMTDDKDWGNILNINIGNRKLLKMLLMRGHREKLPLATSVATTEKTVYLVGKRRAIHKLDEDLKEEEDNENNLDAEEEDEELVPKKSLQQILKAHKNVRLQNTTLPKFFHQTTLETVWMDLDENLLDLAVRTQQMWQYGGVSFKIPSDPASNNPAANSEEITESWNKKEEVQLLRTLIRKGEQQFYQLPEGLVTVDEDALHLETKTSCHAFFGEILMNMKAAPTSVSEKKMLRKTIRSFCKRGAVDAQYCHKMLT